jgi:uncharacterized membrane protein
MSVSTFSSWPTGSAPGAGFATGDGGLPEDRLATQWRWKLGRNCSLAPKQLLLVFVLLATLSLAVAVFFWLMGAPWVLPFACVELLALGVAFVVYTRHAGDVEWIALEGQRLLVARCRGGRWTHWQASPSWVRVGLSPNGLVELRTAGRCLQLGALASSGQRQQLVRELRQALQAQTATPMAASVGVAA